MRARKDLNVCMGERIRQARNAAGYTQEKLAEMIDVTIQYISDLDVKPLYISIRLHSLSPDERKIAESAVDLIIEALQMNPSKSSPCEK